MNNQLASTLINAITYIVLIVVLFVVGQKIVMPIATEGLNRTLIKATNVGDRL